MFTDNTSYKQVDHSLSSIKYITNTNLNIINCWLENNDILLNTKKTFFININMSRAEAEIMAKIKITLLFFGDGKHG